MLLALAAWYGWRQPWAIAMREVWQLSRMPAPDALPVPVAGALYALDGIDDVAGQRDQEIALFDFHNAAGDRGAHLLYSARLLPDEMALTMPGSLSWMMSTRTPSE